MRGGIKRSSSESTSLRVAGVPGEVGEEHKSESSHGGNECSGEEVTEGTWAVWGSQSSLWKHGASRGMGSPREGAGAFLQRLGNK